MYVVCKFNHMSQMRYNFSIVFVVVFSMWWNSMIATILGTVKKKWVVIHFHLLLDRIELVFLWNICSEKEIKLICFLVYKVYCWFFYSFDVYLILLGVENIFFNNLVFVWVICKNNVVWIPILIITFLDCLFRIYFS